MDGERLDLSSNPDPPKRKNRGLKGRRYLGIQFDCCGVYTRVYLNQEETAYEGRCPRCLKPVSIKVGPGGTDNRFFTAR